MAKQKYWDGTKWVQVAPSMEEFNEHKADDTKHIPSNGEFNKILKAMNNTSHTVAQLRNVVLSTEDANGTVMGEGDVWLKYK